MVGLVPTMTPSLIKNRVQDVGVRHKGEHDGSGFCIAFCLL
jgi:hypothetical protein